MSAPRCLAADRYVWSRVFLLPSLQPMSHSPHIRHVSRVWPWRFGYGAGNDRLARHRIATGVGERDGQVGSSQWRPSDVAVSHRPGLGRVAVAGTREGEPLGAEHALDLVVVRLEIGVGDRPVLVPAARLGRSLGEPALVLAQQDVGVDQRSAAEAAGDHRLDVAERPDVEEPVRTLARVPHVGRQLSGATGERPRRIGLAPLQQAHAPAALGQPVGADRTAEAGTHDDGVEMGIRHVGPALEEPPHLRGRAPVVADKLK